MKNAAAVLHGVNDLRFEEAPPLPPRPPAGWVRVRVRAVGICRTDVHFLQHVRSAKQAHEATPARHSSRHLHVLAFCHLHSCAAPFTHLHGCFSTGSVQTYLKGTPNNIGPPQ